LLAFHALPFLFIRKKQQAGAPVMAKLSVQQALLRADGHLRKGEFDSARALYDAVLTVFPKNARAQVALARLNAAKFETMANQAPPQEQIDALIALYNQSRFQELVAQAEALVDEYASSFVVWNILAAGQKALGRLADAENGFRKAAELNPTSADACYNIGVTLQKQGKLDEAVAAYHRALEIKPAYAEVYNNLGNTLKEQGKLDEAIAAYHRALEIKPADAAASYNISVTLQKQGKLDEAITAYQRVLEINPVHAEAYNNMGVMLHEQGKLDQALAAYQRVLEISPAYAEAHYNIGVTLQAQRRLDEAVAAYHRALEIKPAYAEAHYNMGNALKEQGKLDEVIAAYHRALEIKPAYAIVEAQILHQQQRICDFTVYEKIKEASSRLGIETDAVTTFAALPWEDNPSHHQLRAMKWSRERYKQSPLPLPARPKTRSARIKIGEICPKVGDGRHQAAI
jgi:tetratricopeptide (TPR) repeat protein